MDETLIRRAAVVLAACLLCGAAGATPELQDPTRPPAGALAVASGTPKAEAGPQLQAVQVGRASGRVAVIDGESVRAGETFHGARVVRIADNEVELVRGGERQLLRLYAPESAGTISRVAPDAVQHRVRGSE